MATRLWQIAGLTLALLGTCPGTIVVAAEIGARHGQSVHIAGGRAPSLKPAPVNGLAARPELRNAIGQHIAPMPSSALRTFTPGASRPVANIEGVERAQRSPVSVAPIFHPAVPRDSSALGKGTAVIHPQIVHAGIGGPAVARTGIDGTTIRVRR